MAADLECRMFKFPQMDFEMAIWEMTSLLIAPKKVFKSIYYHVSLLVRSSIILLTDAETYDIYPAREKSKLC